MNNINEDMIINDVIDMDPKVEKIFLSHGLNCLGCPGSQTENIREAAEGHDINLTQLLEELNQHFQKKE